MRTTMMTLRMNGLNAVSGKKDDGNKRLFVALANHSGNRYREQGLRQGLRLGLCLCLCLQFSFRNDNNGNNRTPIPKRLRVQVRIQVRVRTRLQNRTRQPARRLPLTAATVTAVRYTRHTVKTLPLPSRFRAVHGPLPSYRPAMGLVITDRHRATLSWHRALATQYRRHL